ncbi:hypothetical protein ACFLWR_01780 [Chloroflexota bacterium]
MEYKASPSSGKLIVINDAPKFTDYLKNLLTEKGYHTVFVDNVKMAQRLLEQEDYDTIVYGHEFLLTEKTRRKIIEERSVVHAGEFIIINDTPNLTNRIANWMEEKRYQYVFVDSIDEANRLLEQKDYDIVMYGHEFSFDEKSPRKK